MKIAAYSKWGRASSIYDVERLERLIRWIKFEVSVGRYNRGEVWIGKA